MNKNDDNLALAEEKLIALEKALILEDNAATKFKLQHEINELKQFVQQSTQENTQKIMLPAQNDNFSGREKVLEQLDDLIHQKSVIALYGLGGVGKTQVAVQYAHLHKHEYDLVLWITAESIEDFQHGLEELALFLNISTDQKQPPQILKEIT